jgi:hypothetical protein
MNAFYMPNSMNANAGRYKFLRVSIPHLCVQTIQFYKLCDQLYDLTVLHFHLRIVDLERNNVVHHTPKPRDQDTNSRPPAQPIWNKVSNNIG